MASVRVEAAAVTVQTTAAGTSPSLAEAASEPTTLALAATCPFIRSVLVSQDPQAISNTLAPFMALANTTNATSAFAQRARGVSAASKRPAAAGPDEPARPAAGTMGSGRDIVGDDWVMTDLSGADDPLAQTGRGKGIESTGAGPTSADVPMVDTAAATQPEDIVTSISPLATSAPEAVAALVPTEATPSTPLAPAGREIAVQAPSQAEPAAEHAPSASAAAHEAAANQAATAKPGETPGQANVDAETFQTGAADPEEAAVHPAGSPVKE